MSDDPFKIWHVQDPIFEQSTFWGYKFSCPVKLTKSEGINYSKRGESKITDEVHDHIEEIFFDDCEFEIVVMEDQDVNVTFRDCKIDSFESYDSVMKGKIRFRNCHFKGRFILENTTFEDLADFWRCTFDESVTFFKTDFLGTTVFSASTFSENVLFTYSLIEKYIIFRGTIFNKGLDLSTAIFPGEVSFFDMRIRTFKALYIEPRIGRFLPKEQRAKKYEEIYDDAITKKSEIPIENKIETLRIIKQRLEGQQNKIASIQYNALEKRAHHNRKFVSLLPRIAIEKGILPTISRNLHAFYRWISSVFEIILLSLNWLSNGHGKSYSRGVIFTLSVGILTFYFLMLSTSKYEYAPYINWDIVSENIPLYAQFLLPTHKFDFLGESFMSKTTLSNWYYLWDILGRIFIGYGIYQTVQAFRKFK